jgi:dihydropteroate synthase
MTNRAWLGGVTVGDGVPVAVAGALNVSPESFYQGSVVTDGNHLLRLGEAMARAGAAFVDVGAMSTAPYLAARIPESEEADHLAWAVDLLVKKLDLPVSADTARAAAARAALDAGARIINDVTGLTGDSGMAPLAARAGAGVIVTACPRRGPRSGGAVEAVRGLLEESLAIARAAGIDPSLIAVDPGIGFFRDQGVAWHEWDCAVLAGLERLRPLGRPICVGVSRKSFIGAVAGEDDPARRLPGSLAATALAVLGGAQLIRAHDVEETIQAVKVAEAICRARERT